MSWKRVLVVLSVIVFCVAIDHAAKDMAMVSLQGKAISYAEGALRLEYFANKGAVLTFEWLLPREWRGTPYTWAVGMFVGALTLFLMFSRVLGPFMTIALAVFCGGCFSNLFDRIAYGQAVDFLNLGWGRHRTGIFNLADVEIAVGLALFAFGGAAKAIGAAGRTLWRARRG